MVEMVCVDGGPGAWLSHSLQLGVGPTPESQELHWPGHPHDLKHSRGFYEMIL